MQMEVGSIPPSSVYATGILAFMLIICTFSSFPPGPWNTAVVVSARSNLRRQPPVSRAWLILLPTFLLCFNYTAKWS